MGTSSGEHAGTAVPGHEVIRDAATGYGMLGWPVVPGVVPFGGWGPQPDRPVVSTMRPALPVGLPLRDPLQVSARWVVEDNPILTPAEDLFGVLVLPSALGWRALDQLRPPLEFPLLRGPGAYYALVEPGTEVWPELSGHGVRMLPAGELVPLPPVPAVFGVWQWLSSPDHRHPTPHTPRGLPHAGRRVGLGGRSRIGCWCVSGRLGWWGCSVMITPRIGMPDEGSRSLLFPPVSHWHAGYLDHTSEEEIGWPALSMARRLEWWACPPGAPLQIVDWVMDKLTTGQFGLSDFRLRVDDSSREYTLRVDVLNPQAVLLVRHLIITDVTFGRCLSIQTYDDHKPYRTVLIESVLEDGTPCPRCGEPPTFDTPVAG